MKKYSGLIKNIIMVVASALTLVAVSFAWFSINKEMTFDHIQASIEGDAVKVDFYQADENAVYQPLEGDIELNEVVPGTYNKYKLVVTTKTSDKLKLGFNIIGLPEDIPQELEDSVEIKYTLYKANKTTAADGTVKYTETNIISQSKEYVPLSDLNDGTIFSGISLSAYQTTASDTFIIYYEIGLSEDASSTVSGMESSLGSLRVSAQRIS